MFSSWTRFKKDVFWDTNIALPYIPFSYSLNFLGIIIIIPFLYNSAKLYNHSHSIITKYNCECLYVIYILIFCLCFRLFSLSSMQLVFWDLLVWTSFHIQIFIYSIRRFILLTFIRLLSCFYHGYRTKANLYHSMHTAVSDACKSDSSCWEPTNET